MVRIYLILLFYTVSSCGSIAVHDNTQRNSFIAKGVSFSNPAGVNFYVEVAEYNPLDTSPETLRKYVSYLLDYRGISEVSSDTDADYIIQVRYISYATNRDSQALILRAFSKRVLQARGKEAGPAWIASVEHLGEPRGKDKMLAMMSIAMRNFVGSNSSVYEKHQGISPYHASVTSLHELIEAE